METLKKITALEAFAVRHPVLRPGKPAESCHFEGDELPATEHYGYFDGGKLVGIISVFENDSPAFDAQKQFQLRGMAVLESHQKKGIGEKLVRFAEKEIAKKRGEIIWFNARISASEFYRKMDYKASGDVFEIKDVGPHYLMFRDLRD